MADERDILLRNLVERNDELVKQTGALTKVIAELREEIARLKQDSSNSHKPPSADAPGARRKPVSPTGRSRGGQRGHKPHKRELLPVEEVTKTIELVPKRCGRCEGRLSGRDPTPERVQSVELPPVAREVTEYRQHELCCAACGAKTREPLPAGFQTFGPRLRATLSAMTGRFRLSKREAQQFAHEVLGIQLSLGSISNLEGAVSKELADAVEAAREFLRRRPVVHPDETGWREGKRKSWLWTAVGHLVTVFRISRSRGAGVAREMLGDDFAGFVISDRWSGYSWLELRQICWSHLRRDFQGFVDRGGVGASIGSDLLKQVKTMFEWHRAVGAGKLSRDAFQLQMAPVEQDILRLLRDAAARAERKTAGMAREILLLQEFLFTFVDNASVEPTNNIAERAIRPAVLWRKGSFGTDSERGSRFAERILTVVATLKQQQRSLIDYLVRAASGSAPSLLPLPER